MPTCVGCSQEIELSVAFCPRCGTPNPDKTLPTPNSGETAEQVPVDELRMKLQSALGADFHVEGLLGEGGFALVFQVQDRKLSRRVAVKVLRPELTASKSSMRRFVREAEAAASLNHPHILPIFFVGEGRGLVYFSMPLVEGETLDALMGREGQLPEAEVVRLGSAIAEALGDAHASGLVHRDVKPANILLQGKNRRPLVADFGIAKAAAGKGDKLTGTGVVIGSPHYMSPEQASGQSSIDHRSDIYSLGVVLWQMLAGTYPFDGPDSQAILVQHITKPLPSLKAKRAGVNAALAKVIGRCTAKKPDDRYQTAVEVAEALRACAIASASARRPRRWPLLVVAVATVVVVAVVALLLVSRGGGAAKPAPGEVPAADNSRPISPVVAVLPFQVLTSRDTFQAARSYGLLLTDAVSARLGVPATDWNKLVSRWTAERRSLTASPDSNAAFAYRLGANQVVLGNFVEAGNQVRLAVSVYDTRTYQRLPPGLAVDGPLDSLPGLIDRLALEVGRALCLQPEFNPRNLCFDRPAAPVAPLRVAVASPPGGVLPSVLRFEVLVSRVGTVEDTRLRDVVSFPELVSKALRAVQSSTYQPARLNGAPVDAWAEVPVNIQEALTAVQAVRCAEPAFGAPNRGNECYDSRPVPWSEPAVQAPPSCSVASPAIVLARVSAEGVVVVARLQGRSSCTAFNDAALAFVRDLVFRPARKGANAVPAWVLVPVRPLKR